MQFLFVVAKVCPILPLISSNSCNRDELFHLIGYNQHTGKCIRRLGGI